MNETWFQDLFGFQESHYHATQAMLVLQDNLLTVKTSPPRVFDIGLFTTPSLAQLRAQVAALPPSHNKKPQRPKLHAIRGDAYALHGQKENHQALIQVASQFNALEMASPERTPEHGITQYSHDNTQGPACALACAPATLYRNYLLPMPNGQTGQSRHQQLNNLDDVITALDLPQLQMKNGYALLDEASVKTLAIKINAFTEAKKDMVRQQLKVGLQSNTQVTVTNNSTLQEQKISQVFCSALPIAYQGFSANKYWQPFAQLVLDASYEATLLAAILNNAVTGNPKVYLTLIGAGVFGNERSWVLAAIKRAIQKIAAYPLEIFIVSHGEIATDIQALVEEMNLLTKNNTPNPTHASINTKTD